MVLAVANPASERPRVRAEELTRFVHTRRPRVLRRPAAMRAIPAPRMAMPIKARTPVNEEPEPELPLPVFGAIGVLSAAGRASSHQRRR